MEKKLSPTRVKAISLVLMIILVAAFSLLVDFISAEFSTTLFTNVTYWANTFSVQLAVIVLIAGLGGDASFGENLSATWSNLTETVAGWFN